MKATELCEIIRRKRDSLGLTRKDLADYLGISLKQVENVEENRYQVINDILAIASALGIELTLTDGTAKVFKVKCVRKETSVPELDLPKQEERKKLDKEMVIEIKNRLFGNFQEMAECTGISVNILHNMKHGRQSMSKYASLAVLHSKMSQVSLEELCKFKSIENRWERWVKFQNFIHNK